MSRSGPHVYYLRFAGQSAAEYAIAGALLIIAGLLAVFTYSINTRQLMEEATDRIDAGTGAIIIRAQNSENYTVILDPTTGTPMIILRGSGRKPSVGASPACEGCSGDAEEPLDNPPENGRDTSRQNPIASGSSLG